MACLYHKNRSPYWYIQYVDSDRNKHDKSTGLRADDPNDTVKAKILRAELEAKEYQRVPVAEDERAGPTTLLPGTTGQRDSASWRDATKRRLRCNSPSRLLRGAYRLRMGWLAVHGSDANGAADPGC